MTTAAAGHAPSEVTPHVRGRAADLVTFVVLAFSWSWTAWAIALAAGGRVGGIAQVAGSFGPSLAAIVVLARADGLAAVRRALRSLIRGRGTAGALAVAALVPVVVAVGAVLVDQAMGRTAPLELPPWWAVPLVVGYVMVLGGPLGEELGWRGHLLPALESRWGPMRATLIIGAVWTAWHLPLFLLPDAVQARIPLWLFGAQIVTTSVVYTWLQHLAPRSLAPALVFHTSFNATVGLLLLQPPSDPVMRPLLVALAMLAVVAAVLARTAIFRHAMGGSLGRSGELSTPTATRAFSDVD